MRRRIVDSDTVARPDGDMRVLREPVYARVMLPSSVDPIRYLYPPGRTVFGTLEPEQNWPAR